MAACYRENHLKTGARICGIKQQTILASAAQDRDAEANRDVFSHNQSQDRLLQKNTKTFAAGLVTSRFPVDCAPTEAERNSITAMRHQASSHVLH
jgi:hypothetical protein